MKALKAGTEPERGNPFEKKTKEDEEFQNIVHDVQNHMHTGENRHSEENTGHSESSGMGSNASNPYSMSEGMNSGPETQSFNAPPSGQFSQNPKSPMEDINPYSGIQPNKDSFQEKSNSSLKKSMDYGNKPSVQPKPNDYNIELPPSDSAKSWGPSSNNASNPPFTNSFSNSPGPSHNQPPPSFNNPPTSMGQNPYKQSQPVPGHQGPNMSSLTSSVEGIRFTDSQPKGPMTKEQKAKLIAESKKLAEMGMNELQFNNVKYALNYIKDVVAKLESIS